MDVTDSIEKVPQSDMYVYYCLAGIYIIAELPAGHCQSRGRSPRCTLLRNGGEGCISTMTNDFSAMFTMSRRPPQAT